MIAIQVIIALAGAVVILVRAEPVIARMSRRSPMPMRLAYVALAAAAAAEILYILDGRQPGWLECLTLAAVAILLAADRRNSPRPRIDAAGH